MEFVLGFLVGFLLVILLMWLFVWRPMLKKHGSLKGRYDERQQLVRGIGFKYAFFVLALYDIMYVMTDSIFEKKFIDNSVAVYLGICLAVMVYASYCIWNEGYFHINERPGQCLPIFAVVAALNLWVGIRHICDGTFFTDGRIGTSGINLFGGIMLGIIAIEIFAKWMCSRKEEE